MKIELEEPYKSDWNRGYLVVNSENRKNVILYNSPTDRSTVSYARYVMACSMGKYIDDGLEVDHIDNDKTNDDISNLQILTKQDNHNKEHKTGRTYLDFICPICNNAFKLEKRQSHKINPCCSRRCGAIKSNRTRANKI